MKILLLLLTFGLVAPRVSAYRLIYKEQLYELYHVHFYQHPERIAENVYWLERALRADFANPLNALARIEDETEWERYRYLFTMHVYLKLTELYLRWGSKFDKQVAYFYNFPWRNQNLKSLQRAEALYSHATIYWEEAKIWSDRAAGLHWTYLEEIQNWHDEHWRIEQGELNYQTIIDRQLTRLERVRATFEAMNEDTY